MAVGQKILLDVAINKAQIDQAITSVKDAREAYNALKVVQADLEKQGHKNTTAYIKNEAELKKLTLVINENNRVLTANAQVSAFAEGSTNQLKAATAALTAQYNNLSKEEKENAAIGGVLATRIKINNDELTKQREKLGQTTVGFAQFSKNIGGAIAGNQNLAVAQGALNNVMKANPIILIVSLLGQLFAALQKNEQVMDAIEPVMAAINEVFKVMGDIVIELAKPLITLFQDPMKAMEDFASFIESQVMNRLKSFGVIVEGIVNMDFKKIADGLGMASLGVENITDKVNNYANRLGEAAANANAMAKAQDDLNEAMLRSEELAAKNSIEITRLNKVYEDRTKKDSERIAALKEMSALEEEAFNAQLESAREQQRILEQQFSQATATGDEQKKITEARIKVYNLEAEAIGRQEKAANRIKRLQDEINEAAQKDLDKARERSEKEKKALQDLEQFRLEVAVKNASGIEERIQREIALEDYKRQRLLENEKLLAGERELVIAQHEQAVTDIKKKGEADRKAAQKEGEEKAAQELLDTFNRSLQEHQNYVQGLINQEKERYLSGAITKQEYDAQIQELDVVSAEVRRAIAEEFGQSTISFEAAITDAKIAQKETETQHSIDAEQRKRDFMLNLAGNVAETLNKQSVAYKALASAQTLIDTTQGAIAAYKSFAGMGPVGVALGAAAAALITLKGMQAVAKINATEPPKVPVPQAAEGMLIDVQGPSHAQGGIPLTIGSRTVANIEGKETVAVINKNATPLLRSLSEINHITGGIDFMTDRAPRHVLADGGFVSRNASAQVGSINQMVLADQIADAVSKINVVANINEINRMQQKQVQIKEVSTLA